MIEGGDPQRAVGVSERVREAEVLTPLARAVALLVELNHAGLDDHEALTQRDGLAGCERPVLELPGSMSQGLVDQVILEWAGQNAGELGIGEQIARIGVALEQASHDLGLIVVGHPPRAAHGSGESNRDRR